ncbi:hypothetical protein CL684_01490 [Candidatus Campbellbacteria bacterium]|nr:hypothetical protein [Candidatus Campbellbacteria bacterium]|tara:strand:- start:802 stop:1320 length:519 start_codon:yes stop_codon:yes gene_type:complete
MKWHKDNNHNGIGDKIEWIDETLIGFFWRNSNLTARWALFIIFFWFGILKVFGVSPAGPLVVALVEVMFGSAVTPDSFLIWFGALEAITGILILFPRYERITFLILAFHFIATAFPLLVLPDIAWYGFAQPTLTGQYILKNLALLAIGMFLYGRLRPMSKTHSMWGEDKVIN